MEKEYKMSEEEEEEEEQQHNCIKIHALHNISVFILNVFVSLLIHIILCIELCCFVAKM